MFNTVKISVACSLSVLLVACGGGGTSDSASPSPDVPDLPTTSEPAISQPTQLSARNIEGISQAAPVSKPSLSITNTTDSLVLSVSGISLDSTDHTQFFINIDNDATTGHKFYSHLWDNTGADYMLENKYLFKATTNDYSWGWELIAVLASNSETSTSVTATIPLSNLENVTPIIKAGFIQTNASWDAVSATPAGSQMEEYQLQNIDIPLNSDVIKPTINITGSQSVTLQVGDSATYEKVRNLGATATDNVDGDITSSLITDDSLVNINAVGTYPILYRVSDYSGNTSEHARNIEVVSSNTAVPSFTIDGDLSDWSAVGHLVYETNSSIKLDSDDDYIYVAVSSDNPLIHPQLFLDVDSNVNTGYQIYEQQWSGNGADFLLENGYLNQYQGNGSTWSWSYDVSTIDYVHTTSGGSDIVEIAIKRSALKGLGNEIKLGFVNAGVDWTRSDYLPANWIATYTLSASNNNDLASADRKDISLYGDPMLERIVGMQLSTMKQILDLPIHGSTIYSSDIYNDTKSYAYARNSDLITVLNRDAITGNFTAGKEIALPFAPRTGAKNKTLELELITGSLKPMYGLIDATTDELIKFGGRNIDTHADDTNHGSKWATGHGNWLTDTHFIMPDREKRELILYKVDPVTKDVTQLNSIFTDSSVHAVIGGLNNAAGIYYATTEGADTANPGLVKFILDNDEIRYIDQVHLIGDDPTIMGGHHAGTTPGGKFIYMGSIEGTLNVIDVEKFEVVKTIPVGKGAGHRTLVASKNLAFITNHTDTFVSVIDTSTNTKIKDIEVSGPKRNDQVLQAHTARVSPDGKYYYNFATDNGFLFRIDTDTLEVDKVYYTGGTPKQASQPGEVN